MRPGFNILKSIPGLFIKSAASLGLGLATYIRTAEEASMREKMSRQQQKDLEEDLNETKILEQIITEQNISNLNKVEFG